MTPTSPRRGPRRTHAVLDSPVGPLVGVVQDGALVQLGPPPPHSPGALPTAAGGRGTARATPPELGERDDDALPALREQLDAYWAGTLREFDLPLAPPGTPWQQQVWAALRTIPFGETWTYGEVAARLGRPTASRAVGAANGRNPVFLVVPCHRVVGSTGALTGYAGGLDMKRRLLDHERATAWARP